MPSKNPLGKIKDVADAAVSTAVGTAVSAVGSVAAKVPVPGRGKPARKPEPALPPAVRQEAEVKVHGDPLRSARVAKAPAKKAAVKKAPVTKPAAKKPAAKNAPAKKPAAKKPASKKSTTTGQSST